MIVLTLLAAALDLPPVVPAPPPHVFVATSAPISPGPPFRAAEAWVADGGTAMCSIRRSFAAADDVVLLSIMPWPNGARTEIRLLRLTGADDRASGATRLMSDDGGRAELRLAASGLLLAGARFGSGALILGPGGTRVTGRVSTGLIPATPDLPEARLTTLDLPAALPALETANTLTIETDPVGAVTLPLTDVADVLTKLRACQAAQAREWGIGPDEVARIATPARAAVGDVGYWFGSDDYPKAALRAGTEGIVIFRWTIEADGRTSGCAVVQSSGSADLDTATCAVIARHRYDRPALDTAGKPMVSHALRRVIWRLPQ